MKLKQKIGLIGCGSMGGAILKGLLCNRIAQASQIFVSDAIAAKKKTFAKRFHVRTVSNNADVVRRAQIILLAVKPQDFVSVALGIRGLLGSGQTVVSILAGTPISKLKRSLGQRAAIIRAMPNLGAQVGEAITAVTAQNPKALKLAEAIFSGCGKVVRLPEKYFDLVTAISGSGPAYFFLVMELMSSVAQKGGIPQKTAELLAVQTALGAAQLAQVSSESPQMLRKMVTSRGGTTEAAFHILEQKGFSKIFQAALKRAADRARELSQM
ncbi:MAG: pyrroline-5-carboxylate reductase [Omnitrophica bacterium RIFCSPHIGHO2_02_FULL_46_11]|nr:MAG: pyrroline-5-carboxylate reductase [Omnitrophica bacterium RIFCSPHIGHO2_02_FULL_46_11]OGW85931.1 MAG: pyrroline-5-carboxylate reductase [Omnitrophica bacterium RIFCSPLOWO2_01_FULL_45_10b]